MLRARSSNAARVVGALALCWSLFACAQQKSDAPGAGTPAGRVERRVGYVRMDDLVKVHPLYPELARLDEDVQALELRSVGSEIARSGADIAKEGRALQHELDVAAAGTKKALNDKQQQYASRERAAIDAAIGAVPGALGPGGEAIAGGIAAQSREQARAATAAAQHNFNAYRNALIAQDEAAVRSLQTSLGERAERTYRARAEELQRKEADFALQRASDDAAERLTLRTKLSNLALDDTSREDVKRRLDALDRKESDALAAMKNRDQTTLLALQKRLHAGLRAELMADAAKLRARTVAKINDRELDTRRSLIAQIGVPQTAGAAAPANGIAPDMRVKLEALHRKYQSDFNKDAAATIGQFQKTRADLGRRFAQLAGADTSAQAGAAKAIGTLQKQRTDLYAQMVAQIGREVKTLAAKRGIDVVVSGVVAPGGGVDLTADAEKDVESLHE